MRLRLFVIHSFCQHFLFVFVRSLLCSCRLFLFVLGTADTSDLLYHQRNSHSSASRLYEQAHSLEYESDSNVDQKLYHSCAFCVYIPISRLCSRCLYSSARAVPIWRTTPVIRRNNPCLLAESNRDSGHCAIQYLKQ